jgi:hypothetical protein
VIAVWVDRRSRERPAASSPGTRPDCDDCPDNPYLIHDSKSVADAFQALFTVARRRDLRRGARLLIRAGGGRRRRSAASSARCTSPAAIAAALVAALFVVVVVLRPRRNVLGVVAFIAFGTVPLFFLAGLLRDRLYRAAPRLLREVPDEPRPSRRRRGSRCPRRPDAPLPHLARTSWRLRRRPRQPVELVPDTPRRVTTRIDRESTAPRSRARPRRGAPAPAGLLDEVVSAARLAIEKDRGLQALRRSEARSRALLDAIPT